MQALYHRPEEGLERLAEEVEGYWEAAMAPYWPRIRSLLEGEILHQHLTALRRAGLCTAHRTGRYVLYARTAAAEALLAPHAAKPG